MNAIEHILARQIAMHGPLSVADFMSTTLMHPEHGYYVTRPVFGAQGDFITAPEISQMFGELVGLALAQAWIDQGTPDNVVLAELGPGRGTLMSDILRATQSVPKFHDALTVHFVETSNRLRQRQRETVPDAIWHDDVTTLPYGPLFLVANEFFDALPIRQFIRDGNAWSERMVTRDSDKFTWAKSRPMPVMELEPRINDTSDGDLVEDCPSARAIVHEIAERIANYGGAGLIIDYGDWRSLGDTLQALHNHTVIDPLTKIGLCDLTAHVDYEALANTITTTMARHTRVTPQGVFLERLGITQRAQALAARMTGDTLDNHIKAHRRLTHPDEMGTLFKVMGIYPDGANPPAGLEA